MFDQTLQSTNLEDYFCFLLDFYFKMLSVLEESRRDDSSQVGMVSFDCIDWDKFKTFDEKQSFLEFSNHILESVKQLPRGRLMDLQVHYYNIMLRQDTELLFSFSPP